MKREILVTDKSLDKGQITKEDISSIKPALSKRGIKG